MGVRGGKAYRQNVKVKEFIRSRDNSTCQLCGCKVGDVCDKHYAPVVQMDVAHIKLWDHSPQSSSLANLQLQCHSCNVLQRKYKDRVAPGMDAWRASILAWSKT